MPTMISLTRIAHQSVGDKHRTVSLVDACFRDDTRDPAQPTPELASKARLIAKLPDDAVRTTGAAKLLIVAGSLDAGNRRVMSTYASP